MPQDLCNITMDNDCSIAMLLPSTKGISVCSMALLFFLVNTNNEFLGIYRSATNQERYCSIFIFGWAFGLYAIFPSSNFVKQVSVTSELNSPMLMYYTTN